MKLVLIDGHSLAYRAFFALPPDMATSKGELTNAVYGFTSMLLNIIRDHKPTHMAVAFDVGRSFRHDKFEEYKATRERIPDELSIQIDRIQELIDAFRIPVFTKEGYEADDVLATLAHQAEAQGAFSLITTGDRDLVQVVDEKIWVLTSGRKFSDVIIFTPDKVRERYGLEPRQIVDFKALVGDKSDNIPGVRGIGEKTAVKLLQQWGDLDNIYAHIDEITPTRVRNALIKGREDAYLSRALAQIVDVPGIQLDLKACEFGDYDRQRVLKLFTELEFRTLIPRLPEPQGHGVQQLGLFGEEDTAGESTAPHGYRAVTTRDDLDDVLPIFSKPSPWLSTWRPRASMSIGRGWWAWPWAGTKARTPTSTSPSPTATASSSPWKPSSRPSAPSWPTQPSTSWPTTPNTTSSSAAATACPWKAASSTR